MIIQYIEIKSVLNIYTWVCAQMGGCKPILPCGCHCNAHVVL